MNTRGIARVTKFFASPDAAVSALQANMAPAIRRGRCTMSASAPMKKPATA
jgi:hypothetical protein